MVRFACCVAIQQLDGYDAQVLAELGFLLDLAAASCDPNGPSNGANSRSRINVSRSRERESEVARGERERVTDKEYRVALALVATQRQHNMVHEARSCDAS